MSFFSEVKNQRLYEAILLQIKELIHSEKMKPGDRLPSERAMAEALGCSRTSLREAFRVLESEGLVESRQGGGRFIHCTDRKLIMSYSFMPVAAITKSSLLLFLEARETLEPKIAQLACLRATDDELVQTKRKLDQLAADFENPKRKLHTPLNFHLSLAEMSHNYIFLSMMQANANLIQQTRKWTLVSQNRRSEDAEEHLAIFNAVFMRNETLAIQSTLNHLRALRYFVMNME
jgi:Transcriptional regulators